MHADETPVAMLKTGHSTTHRAYLWSYCTTKFNPLTAVVFDFADSRVGQHARDFLGLPDTPDQTAWQGNLICDDFAGYKACFEPGITEGAAWPMRGANFERWLPPLTGPIKLGVRVGREGKVIKVALLQYP